jgi:hypothetical protein
MNQSQRRRARPISSCHCWAPWMSVVLYHTGIPCNRSVAARALANSRSALACDRNASRGRFDFDRWRGAILRRTLQGFRNQLRGLLPVGARLEVPDMLENPGYVGRGGSPAAGPAGLARRASSTPARSPTPVACVASAGTPSRSRPQWHPPPRSLRPSRAASSRPVESALHPATGQSPRASARGRAAGPAPHLPARS